MRPGIRFQVQAPSVPDELPRMDVAAFVGFAASGPLHVPVVVEDVARFHALFGEDLPLAVDAEREETVHAHLAPTVRAFFRNGGRRCWVVRVAGAEALSNLFPLPGLFRRSSTGALEPAFARARSEGSWSDTLQVTTALSAEPLLLQTWRVSEGTVELTVAAPEGLSPGDLLRVRFTGSGHTLLLPVEATEPDEGAPATGRRTQLRARGGHPLWLQGETVLSGAPESSALPPDANGSCERLTFGLWVRREAEQPLRLEGLGLCPEHPRYWGALPTDAEWVRRTEGELSSAPLRGETVEPRFPLAGQWDGDEACYFPLGMEFLPGDWRGPIPSDVDALERDGLKEFHSRLFLDEALRPVGLRALRGQADFLRYQSPRPRELQGLHALFSKADVTLVAVPDAVHRPWKRVVPGPPPEPPPPEPPPEPEWGSFLPCDTRAQPPPASPSSPPAPHGPRWALTPEEDYPAGHLLAIQRALLRLCAARGDLLAILSLPEHYREDEAIAHAAALRAPLAPEEEGVPPLGFAERHALSHGALYHPWTFTSEQGGATPRRMPPEGAACGVIARRTLERGAWLAPANEPWSGVVALTPALSRARWTQLQEARVNVLLQEPRGFLTLSESTLAEDSELLPIHVRRLLALLRRAALQLGSTYVFEPNDASFHRLVQRGFEGLLGNLFRRGAFAGRTRESAFQVVTGSERNTPESLEQGRFFVELKVAPSTPLTFLDIRLVQSGDHGLATEER